MNKLTLIAATAAAFLCASFAPSSQARAQDGNNPQQVPIIGEKGAKWGGQCWVDTSGGAYFGYWAPCTPPASANTAGR